MDFVLQIGKWGVMHREFAFQWTISWIAQNKKYKKQVPFVSKKSLNSQNIKGYSGFESEE